MKYIVVTGSCGGMGKSTIKELLNKGYGVIALDINKSDDLNLPNVNQIICDVTSEESVQQAFEMTFSITQEIYSIIHFAGMYVMDSLVEIEYPNLDKIFKVNFFGVYLINKTFLPLLNKGSRIITITSELAPLNPLPFTGIYAITKSTLDKYCYSLRMELQLLGIEVAVLRAGAVQTAMLGESTSSLDKFCEKTKLYNCNAKNFRNIVNKVETKCIPPEKIATKVIKMIETKNLKFAYKINANKYLRILSKMPKKFQFWIIRKILK